MKEIRFNKLTIKNFRNINELEINFNNDVTEIMASNGKGKTNTLSSIMWCLFGKNINDDKLFTISPIIDGEEDNSINTVVKMVINGNYVIERSYCKRVTTLKTGYVIDDKEQLVSVSQTQLKQELVENLVDEETFKSLSNINYIPNLHWKDLKKLIFDLIGDIKDEEILLRDDFALIEEYITKFGIDQTQKLLNETDKDLNDDIKRLETEYQTLINTKEKYVSTEEQNKELENRKLEIEKLLYANQEQNAINNKSKEEYNFKKDRISNLEYEISKIKNDITFNESNIEDYKKLYVQNGFDVEILRSNDIGKLEYKLKTLKDSLFDKNMWLDKYKVELGYIKFNGNELKLKEVKVENSTCSACGQSLPEEMINSTLNKLKEQRDTQLKELKGNYDECKDKIVTYEREIEDINKEIENTNKEIEVIKTKVYETVDETDKQKQLRVAKEEKELLNVELNKKVLLIENDLKLLKEDFDKLEEPKDLTIEDNTNLKLELNDINSKLATSITLSKISEDIESTLKNLNTKKDKKVINKDKLLQVVKFNNVKADLLKQKVRSYFDLVEFKTKEFTNDGVEQETFKICNDKGIEWKDINTGHKILLGIDLLKGIQKAKEISIPLIIDNAETVTNDISVKDTQIIIAKAIKGIEKLEVK